MPSSNNTIILDGCISEYQNSNELTLPDSDLFELFTVAQLTKQYELSFEEFEDSIVDGGQDGGIDSFLILVNDKSISSEDQLDDFSFSSTTILAAYIVQSKTETSFKESFLDKLISTVPLLFDLALSENELLSRFNSKLVEKIIIFRKAWATAIRKNAKIRIEYAYACRANEVQTNAAYNSKCNQIVSSTEERVHGASVFFNNYSSKQLLALYYKSKSTNLEIQCKEAPISVKYETGNYGYLAVANLNDYYSFLIDEDGFLRENLFENNIRHYQGDVDVNRSIQETLAADLLSDFWWLNNGITIIASGVRQIGKTLTLEDVQIVNGLQTSYTIGKYYEHKDNDDRSILLKVIITNDKETIDKIIAATNRQNPVSPTLLRATDETQRTIELYFLNKSYFYDRRKNYYKNQGKPASRIFSIQFTAQSIQAIMNFDPATARAKPTSLLKDDKSYSNIFNSNTDYDVFLLCCLISQKTTQCIKDYLSSDNKRIVQNFSYHIARILVSLITNKPNYNIADLKSCNIEDVNETNFISAYNYLASILESYQETYPDENIINISKSKKFVDSLNASLVAAFRDDLFAET